MSVTTLEPPLVCSDQLTISMESDHLAHGLLQSRDRDDDEDLRLGIPDAKPLPAWLRRVQYAQNCTGDYSPVPASDALEDDDDSVVASPTLSPVDSQDPSTDSTAISSIYSVDDLTPKPSTAALTSPVSTTDFITPIPSQSATHIDGSGQHTSARPQLANVDFTLERPPFSAAGGLERLKVEQQLSFMERIQLVTTASSLKLKADLTGTFSKDQRLKCKLFGGFIAENFGELSRGHRMPQILCCLVSIRGVDHELPKTRSPTNEVYICIRGLASREEITRFHLAVSQRVCRSSYAPLKLCYDMSLVLYASTEHRIAEPSEGPKQPETTCGRLLLSSSDGEDWVSTIGGLMEIDGKYFLMAGSNHYQEDPEGRAGRHEPDHPPLDLNGAAGFELDDDASPPLLLDEKQELLPRGFKNGPACDISLPHCQEQSHRLADTDPRNPSHKGTSWLLVPVPVFSAYFLPNYVRNPPTFLANYCTDIEESPVLIQAGISGDTVGRLYGTPSYLITNGALTEVWTVQLERGESEWISLSASINTLVSLILTRYLTDLQRGDSGSWVLQLESSSVLGSIVAISDGYAYMVSLEDQIKEIQMALKPRGNVNIATPFDVLMRLSDFYHSHDLGRAYNYTGQALSSTRARQRVNKLETSLRTVWATLDTPSERHDFLVMVFSTGLPKLEKILKNIGPWFRNRRNDLSDVRLSNLRKLGEAYRGYDLQDMTPKPKLRRAFRLAALFLARTLAMCLLWGMNSTLTGMNSILMGATATGRAATNFTHRGISYRVKGIILQVASIPVFRDIWTASQATGYRDMMAVLPVVIASGLAAAMLSTTYLQQARILAAPSTKSPPENPGVDVAQTSGGIAGSPMQGAVLYAIFVGSMIATLSTMRLVGYFLMKFLLVIITFGFIQRCGLMDFDPPATLMLAVGWCYNMVEAICIGLFTTYPVLAYVLKLLRLQGTLLHFKSPIFLLYWVHDVVLVTNIVKHTASPAYYRVLPLAATFLGWDILIVRGIFALARRVTRSSPFLCINFPRRGLEREAIGFSPRHQLSEAIVPTMTRIREFAIISLFLAAARCCCCGLVLLSTSVEFPISGKLYFLVPCYPCRRCFGVFRMLIIQCFCFEKCRII